MIEWLSQINPWVGSALTAAALGLSVWRIRVDMQRKLEAAAAAQLKSEAADRNLFRRSLLEHIAYVEDKNRTLEQRIGELESTHRRTEEAYRKQIADLQERYAETQRKHLECEERILQLMKAKGSSSHD